MSCYLLWPKPTCLILQIPYIWKYLDLSNTILCVSEIRIRSVFHNLKSLFSATSKYHKNNYYDRYYDIPSKIEMIIV